MFITLEGIEGSGKTTQMQSIAGFLTENGHHVITTRENSFNINRTWTAASLNMGVQWFDNVAARQTDSEDTTLQK
ncbi:MAG: hypothetical protein HQK67_09130, partial [Desulfamplus sp.]|nr:hypothetical protein [Desulfamplus sp.]